MPRPFPFSASLHTLLLLLRMRLPVSSGWGTSHVSSAHPSSPPVCFPPLTTAIIGVIYSDSHIIRTSLGTERSGTPSRCAPRPVSSSPVWLELLLSRPHTGSCRAGTSRLAGPQGSRVAMVQDGGASAPFLGFQRKLLD